MGCSDSQLRIERLLPDAANGDPEALREVIEVAYSRLTIIARKMLLCFPKVRRFEQTGDLLHVAYLRISRAIQQTKPKTILDFTCIATRNIRFACLDLARQMKRHVGQNREQAPGDEIFIDPADGPSTIAEWQEFHERVSELPEDELAVFDLIFYGGMKQESVAQQLNISVSSVQRKLVRAKLRLREVVLPKSSPS